MHDAIEVVKALLQDYSDETLLYLMQLGAERVKENAEAAPWSETLSPLESANGYISRRMDKIINQIRGVLEDD